MTVTRTGSRIHDTSDTTLGINDVVPDRQVRLLIAESESDAWSRMAEAVLAQREVERKPCTTGAHAQLARCSCEIFEAQEAER